MEVLRAKLCRVRIPEPTTRVYKQECFISFDTPKSEGGLFIDMTTFLAFGKDYVGWNFEKTGNPVYLHIIQTQKPVSEDRPLKKPTLLAIVQVRLAVNSVLMVEGAERKEQLAFWSDDKKQASAYAMNLQQLENGVTIRPSGWKCSKCYKTENLWLNLTDGLILCGRKNWDGTGGNNHAIEHYKETGYPLAVKLGTITADIDAAGTERVPDKRRWKMCVRGVWLGHLFGGGEVSYIGIEEFIPVRIVKVVHDDAFLFRSDKPNQCPIDKSLESGFGDISFNDLERAMDTPKKNEWWLEAVKVAQTFENMPKILENSEKVKL